MKAKLKKLIPIWLKDALKNILKSLRKKKKNRESIFTEVYEKNIWGTSADGRKFFSGGGTDDANVEKYKEVLIKFIENNNVKSLFEIGCGDFTIMDQLLKGLHLKYTGSDVVKNLVDHLSNTYGNENTSFLHMDAVTEKNIPTADLCIIRQVLQHLSNEDIAKVLKKTAKFKYVIITEHLPLNPKVINANKSTNHGIRLDYENISGVFLDAPPYSLKCSTLLSYRADHGDVPAVMQTSLIENPQ